MSKTIMKNRVINFKDKNFDIKGELFWVKDMYEFSDIFDEVRACTQIFVPKEDRRKGIGSKLLQDYIKENIGNDKLYFVQAGFSKEEYTEEEFENATIEERNELFNKLDKFYTKNGFFNINYFIGAYENTVMYLYTNEAAIKLLEQIISNAKTYNLHNIILDNNIMKTYTITKKDGTLIEETIYKKYDEDRTAAYINNTNNIYGAIVNIVPDSKCIIDTTEIQFTNNISILIEYLETLKYRFQIIKKIDNIINKKDYFADYK